MAGGAIIPRIRKYLGYAGVVILIAGLSLVARLQWDGTFAHWRHLGDWKNSLESDATIEQLLRDFHAESAPLFNFTASDSRAHTRPDDRDYPVPNIVHYVWFGGAKARFRFDNMLSVLSVYRILQPAAIYFHCDAPPVGAYWNFVRQIPTLRIVHADPPRELFGEKTPRPKYDTSDSNLYRVKVVWEQGGLYLDTDAIVVNKMDVLRNYSCSLGYELKDRICGGVIMGAAKSAFLYMWLNSYLDDNRVSTWAYNSGIVPSRLARRYPEAVHVVERKFHRPNWQRPQLPKIWFTAGYRWWENYTVHLWYRVYRRDHGGPEPSLSNIKQWRGTFGQIARYILYGIKPPAWKKS